MFEIWEGDLYLYSVDTREEADEQREAGFTVKSLEYYGAWLLKVSLGIQTVGSGPGFITGTPKKVPVFLTFVYSEYILLPCFPLP